MTDPAGAQPGLFRLMTWLSPAFPIGGFAWSAGLEAACHAGQLASTDDLTDWITTSLNHGPLHNDAVLLAAAYGAKDSSETEEINALALSLAGSRERYDETIALGGSFVEAAMPWRDVEAADLPNPITYPIAVGRIASENTLPLHNTLTAFLHATLTHQVQAALRLMSLGQKAGLEVTAALESPIMEKADWATQSTLDDLGSAALMMDIASMNHETQPSRIFRS